MNPSPPALSPPHATRARGLALMFGWRRLVTAAIPATLVGMMLGSDWRPNSFSIFSRAYELALLALVVFGTLERWPKRLPPWLARWVLQVVAVGLAMPLGTLVIYVVSTPAGQPPFWQVPDRLEGFTFLTLLGVMIAPWVALGALVRQKETFARDQALAFELERSELERRALDARLRLLQAQVAPHFLFNTLANVQALVDVGSPKASEVLRSLTAYLRAAVPRLDEASTTLGRELELVRAYLELMHTRMPDRLQFDLHVDPDALGLHCPPMTLLTLVENAVRHGIDPSEEGGRIEVVVERRGDRCRVAVRDSGVGLGETGAGLGTGLSSLRERLRLVFGAGAQLRVSALEPRGVCAEIDLPALGGAGA